MKIKKWISIIIVLAISLTKVAAQPSEGAENNTNDVPLNYTELLIGAGALFGIVVLKSKSKKREAA